MPLLVRGVTKAVKVVGTGLHNHSPCVGESQCVGQSQGTIDFPNRNSHLPRFETPEFM